MFLLFSQKANELRIDSIPQQTAGEPVTALARRSSLAIIVSEKGAIIVSRYVIAAVEAGPVQAAAGAVEAQRRCEADRPLTASTVLHSNHAGASRAPDQWTGQVVRSGLQ